MLDRTDYRILAALTADGRASVEAVAEAVSLSPTPVRRRIRAMEEAGVIKGYAASIDPEKCGFETLLYVFIKLKSRDRETIADFEERVRLQPEIQKCDLITGAHDYVLMVRMASMKAYNDYLREKLAELPGVFGIETCVVIGHVKDVTFLPTQPPKV